MVWRRRGGFRSDVRHWSGRHGAARTERRRQIDDPQSGLRSDPPLERNGPGARPDRAWRYRRSIGIWASPGNRSSSTGRSPAGSSCASTRSCRRPRIPTSRPSAAIALVDMADAADRPVGGYSKGMRQRIKVAAALVHDPRVLLLDEPLNGTDPVQRASLIALIRRLGDEGKTVVVSSHVLSEVERFARNVLVIVNGKLAAAGDFRTIRERMDERDHIVRIRCDDPRRLAAALVVEPVTTSIRMARRQADRGDERRPSVRPSGAGGGAPGGDPVVRDAARRRVAGVGLLVPGRLVSHGRVVAIAAGHHADGAPVHRRPHRATGTRAEPDPGAVRGDLRRPTLGSHPERVPDRPLPGADRADAAADRRASAGDGRVRQRAGRWHAALSADEAGQPVAAGPRQVRGGAAGHRAGVACRAGGDDADRGAEDRTPGIWDGSWWRWPARRPPRRRCWARSFCW